ncbi:hypothetical protein LTR95_005509 [Oleoguttula sp. CCFEE 5521]
MEGAERRGLFASGAAIQRGANGIGALVSRRTRASDGVDQYPSRNRGRSTQSTGVFVDNGTVSFVTSFHKGFSAGGKTEIIRQYVSNEVGELVVYYMCSVGLWVQQLQAGCRKRTTFPSWVWEPQVEASWDADEDADAAEMGGEDDRERNAAGPDHEKDVRETSVAPGEAGGVDRKAQSVDEF